MMKQRGIDNPDQLLAFAAPERIVATCRWWDGKRGAGPGVLASAIRQGGVLTEPRQGADSVQRSAEYQASVWAWIAENLPDLCDEQGLASPHAVAAVFRLHHVYGKGQLTVAAHGPALRHAVRRMDSVTAAHSSIPTNRKDGAK